MVSLIIIPFILFWHSPKSIFIMGGGEGSTAREILRHKTVEKVVMCDIDEVIKFFFPPLMYICYSSIEHVKFCAYNIELGESSNVMFLELRVIFHPLCFYSHDCILCNCNLVMRWNFFL